MPGHFCTNGGQLSQHHAELSTIPDGESFRAALASRQPPTGCWYTRARMDEHPGFDPKRRLCPDGTCTGVVGRDGKCGECGRVVATGGNGGVGERKTIPREPASEINDYGPREVLADGDDGTRLGAAARPDGDLSEFDPQRRLCVDGTCVGVIGPNGACTVCRRMAG
jgi:hypothetical protein